MSLATNNSMYPVYVYEEGMDLPKEGTYFVVAGNGIWLHKDTGIVRGFVPVEQISMLSDIDVSVELECSLPKLPARLVWRVKQFFSRVVDKFRAEAEVTLYYNKDKKDYKVHIPKQQVSRAGVRYERAGLTHLEGMADYLRVGTIHSHCDFGAFHSGTDINDEADFDGLHVTFGHNDKDVFTISASVVINGERKKVDPLDFMEGIVQDNDDHYHLRDSDHDPEFHQWADGLDDWMKQVRGFVNWGYGTGFHDGIVAGSRVTWSDDMSSSQLRKIMGDGPFSVIDCENGKIAISTTVGLARLSVSLFKEV